MAKVPSSSVRAFLRSSFRKIPSGSQFTFPSLEVLVIFFFVHRDFLCEYLKILESSVPGH